MKISRFLSIVLISSICSVQAEEKTYNTDLTDVFDEKVIKTNAEEMKKLGIVIPTYEEMVNPNLVGNDIKNQLKNVGMNDTLSVNLFRTTWKNQPTMFGGGFGGVNYIELPSKLTGVKARIVVLVGKWFPTGAHKAGASISCLIPRIVTGRFDLKKHKAAWPSTGNYCRGGVFNSCVFGINSIAILPELMSKERFNWLKKMNCDVIKTPGCESSVKEIYDKCKELSKNNENIIVFNQFEDFGNYIWHYKVTGSAMFEVAERLRASNSKLKVRGLVSSVGSAGTIASGDYLKHKYPWMKIVVGESLQCPTLSENGYGDHRIEGIGDKHVTWIHNVKNTDMVVAIDDEICLQILRLFNTKKGVEFLTSRGVSKTDIENLKLLGISGIANVLSAIKTAKYYQLDENDVVMTVATDSVEMYHSRLQELEQENGEFSEIDANVVYSKLINQDLFGVHELSYLDKKRIHNLKYYTWVEQQGKTSEELDAQWNESYWENIQAISSKLDVLIKSFNSRVVEKK